MNKLVSPEFASTSSEGVYTLAEAITSHTINSRGVVGQLGSSIDPLAALQHLRDNGLGELPVPDGHVIEMPNDDYQDRVIANDSDLVHANLFAFRPLPREIDGRVH